MTDDGFVVARESCNQPPRPASPAQVPQSVSQHRRPAATKCSTRSYPTVGTESQPSAARRYTEPSGSVPLRKLRGTPLLRAPIRRSGPLTGILRLTIRDRPWPGSPHASPPICAQLPVCRSAVRTAPNRTIWSPGRYVCCVDINCFAGTRLGAPWSGRRHRSRWPARHLLAIDPRIRLADDPVDDPLDVLAG